MKKREATKEEKCSNSKQNSNFKATQEETITPTANKMQNLKQPKGMEKN
jgi:hypothetical protein